MNLILHCVLVLAFGLCATGCGNRDRAITVAETTAIAAERAKASAKALSEAAAAQQAASMELRTYTRSLHASYTRASNQQRQTALRLEYLNALQRLNEAASKVADEISQARQRAMSDTTAAIDTAVMPYRSQEQSLAAAAHTSKETLDAAPADRDLRIAWMTAKLNYLAVAAVCRDMQLEGQRAAMAAVEKVADEAIKNLAASLALQRQRLAAAHEEAQAQLKVQHADLDLGPEPTHSAEAYDGLIAFAEGVRKSQAQIRAYLESTGFGKNSLFADALHGFGAGLFSAITPASGVPRTPIKTSESTSEPAALPTGKLTATLDSGLEIVRGVVGNLLDQFREAAKASASQMLQSWQERLRSAGVRGS